MCQVRGSIVENGYEAGQKGSEQGKPKGRLLESTESLRTDLPRTGLAAV